MSELADAFQGATRLAVELEMTPRWRRRKRERLQARLDIMCARADRARQHLGASADAAGLAEILRRAQGAGK